MSYPIPTSQEYALKQYKGDLYRPINNYLNRRYNFKNVISNTILDKYIEYIDNAMVSKKNTPIKGELDDSGNLVVYRGMPNIKEKFETGTHMEKSYWSTSTSKNIALDYFGKKYSTLLRIHVPDTVKLYQYPLTNFEKEVLLQRNVIYTVKNTYDYLYNNDTIKIYDVYASSILSYSKNNNNTFYNATPKGIAQYNANITSKNRVKQNISNRLRKNGGMSNKRNIKHKTAKYRKI